MPAWATLTRPAGDAPMPGKLEFDHIIGGHGTVKSRAHLTFFRNIADLIAAVRARDGA
jgi:hypothetical protein